MLGYVWEVCFMELCVHVSGCVNGYILVLVQVCAVLG